MPASSKPPRVVPKQRTKMVEVRFLVPPAWRDALAEAAEAQAISMADLCRMVLRGFLRERYGDDARALG